MRESFFQKWDKMKMEIEKSTISELNRNFGIQYLNQYPKTTLGIPNHSVIFTVIGAKKIKKLKL